MNEFRDKTSVTYYELSQFLNMRMKFFQSKINKNILFVTTSERAELIYDSMNRKYNNKLVDDLIPLERYEITDGLLKGMFGFRNMITGEITHQINYNKPPAYRVTFSNSNRRSRKLLTQSRYSKKSPTNSSLRQNFHTPLYRSLPTQQPRGTLQYVEAAGGVKDSLKFKIKKSKKYGKPYCLNLTTKIYNDFIDIKLNLKKHNFYKNKNEFYNIVNKPYKYEFINPKSMSEFSDIIKKFKKYSINNKKRIPIKTWLSQK